MSNTIIAISREFGSGGRLIGEKLALELGMMFYDKSIIQMAAEKSGLSPSFIEQSEENIPNSFLFNLSASAYASFKPAILYDAPINDKTFFAQSSVLHDIAKKDSCVIVGRCADYVLRDEPGIVRIFVHAPVEQRIKRAIETYGLEQDNAAAKLKKIDKSRENYYKYYTGERWGDPKNYDLIINTGFIGIDETVDMLKALLRKKKMAL
ncbi:MAG: cytidylate kinase-like family protein [Oscillospiraceae bacterium]|nr:cytidylate kinase-like family protein [Oscillospiraceae bacterium]